MDCDTAAVGGEAFMLNLNCRDVRLPCVIHYGMLAINTKLVTIIICSFQDLPNES